MPTDTIAPPQTRSTASSPDLDWSQVRETVHMLNLSVLLIEHSMSEGDASIDSLADAFVLMVSEIEGMMKVVETLPDSEQKTSLGSVGSIVTNQVRSVITAFQFYDKLSQRLAHVSNSMNSLSDIILDPARIFNPQEWSSLQQVINSKHTIDKDRKMFDAISNGASLQEAITMTEEAEIAADDDDIELF